MNGEILKYTKKYILQAIEINLIEPFTDVTANKNAIQEVAKHFRKIYNGTIINRGSNKVTVPIN